MTLSNGLIEFPLPTARRYPAGRSRSGSQQLEQLGVIIDDDIGLGAMWLVVVIVRSEVAQCQ